MVLTNLLNTQYKSIQRGTLNLRQIIFLQSTVKFSCVHFQAFPLKDTTGASYNQIKISYAPIQVYYKGKDEDGGWLCYLDCVTFSIPGVYNNFHWQKYEEKILSQLKRP